MFSMKLENKHDKHRHGIFVPNYRVTGIFASRNKVGEMTRLKIGGLKKPTYLYVGNVFGVYFECRVKSKALRIASAIFKELERG